VSSGEMMPWGEFLPGISDYRPVRDPAAPVEPLPAGFCALIMVLSSLIIYGAIYGMIALLN